MIWKKITIETLSEATDIVASVLFDNNIFGAEIEDNMNLSDEELSQMYVDIPKIKIDDGKAKVSFYVSIGNIDKKDVKIDNSLIDNSYQMSNDNIFTDEEFDSVIKNIKNNLSDMSSFTNLGKLTFTEEDLDDNIFLNKWKENFKTLNIDNINIVPNFIKEFDKDKLNIFIEPGNAFGTGQHETTKLCVREINKILSNNKIDNFLDIGCGSGILSIIAEKLGAKNVFAMDVDEKVELNLIENLKLNNISNKYKFDENSNVKYLINDAQNKFIYGFGNILTDEWLKNKLSLIKFDVIVANILSPVIISLIEKANIFSYINERGNIIFSGIINDCLDDVLNVIEKYDNIKNIEVNKENEWCSITLTF